MKGFKARGMAIVVAILPGRKRPVLAIKEGNELLKIASFYEDGAAEYFLEAMEYMFGLNIGEEEE